MLTHLPDRIATRCQPLLMLLGRLAIGALFLPSGFGKLTTLGTFAQSLAAKGVPAAMAFAVLAGLVEFFGSLAIVLGFQTRIAALFLIAFTIVATLLSHHFWTIQDSSRALQHVQFMKNLAIIGGLIFLFAQGPGAIGIDRGGRQ